MFPSISKILTVAAALSATALANPQGFGGSSGGGESSGSSGSSGSSSGSSGSGSSWDSGSSSSGSSGSESGSSTTTSSSWGSSAVATVSSSAASSTSTLSSGTACNNSPDLCSRTYDNITHMGAHDSSFLRDSSTGNSVAGTQFYNATHALNAGLRLFQVQVHDLNGTIEMCHTTCALLDAGTLESWLVLIKDWMDSNTNDVVTLLIVNSDSFNASDFASAFESSGISTYGYTPTTSSASNSWPTLSDMISSNTRLVTFITNMDADSSYSYLLPEFTYVFETAYEVTALGGFNCTLDRPSTYSTYSDAITAGMLPLMNHFAYTVAASIEIPDVSDIAITNSASTNTTGNLGLHAKTCNSEWSQKPTFVLVDFWNKGPSIDTADDMNGITATGRSDTTSSSTSSGGMPVRNLGMGTGALVAAMAGAVLLL